MPHRRRRSPRRRTSRRSRSLDYLLAVVLIVGIGYLLLQPGVLPFPPEATRPSPDANGDAGNAAAIGRLGGAVQYGHVDRVTGQRSGASATITPAMVAAAARDELGSAADPDIRPPGLDQLPARNRARAHLLGRQLGGTGDLPANLVALYQTRANTLVMRDYETAVGPGGPGRRDGPLRRALPLPERHLRGGAERDPDHRLRRPRLPPGCHHRQHARGRRHRDDHPDGR
jgi:hypothetical protein